jgi:hypothetical protein
MKLRTLKRQRAALAIARSTFAALDEIKIRVEKLVRSASRTP